MARIDYREKDKLIGQIINEDLGPKLSRGTVITPDNYPSLKSLLQSQNKMFVSITPATESKKTTVRIQAPQYTQLRNTDRLIFEDNFSAKLRETLAGLDDFTNWGKIDAVIKEREMEIKILLDGLIAETHSILQDVIEASLFDLEQGNCPKMKLFSGRPEYKKIFGGENVDLDDFLDIDRFYMGHSLNTGSIAVNLYLQMNYNKIKQGGKYSEKLMQDLYVLGHCGYLHDLGKFAIRKEVLQKEKFSNVEWDIMKKHPELSAKILFNYFKDYDISLIEKDSLKGVYKNYAKVCVAALGHHYKFDRSGYPDLAKDSSLEDIIRGSKEAKIISVADVFDALTTPRHYQLNQFEGTDRLIFTPADVIYILYKECRKYDNPQVTTLYGELMKERILEFKEVVKALISIFGLYPLSYPREVVITYDEEENIKFCVDEEKAKMFREDPMGFRNLKTDPVKYCLSSPEHKTPQEIVLVKNNRRTPNLPFVNRRIRQIMKNEEEIIPVYPDILIPSRVPGKPHETLGINEFFKEVVNYFFREESSSNQES